MDELQSSRFTKFRIMMRDVSRWWTACGFFTLLVLMAGCDPCMNNPCDNGLACDGLETCTADGGQAVCGDGTPVSCDATAVCTEPDGACVDQGTTDGDGSPVQVDVLQLGSFFYPTGLFRCAASEEPREPDEFCTDGAGCDEFHWHSDTVAAISSTTEVANVSANTITDPLPCKCGHGKVSEVTRTTIDIDLIELGDYLEARILDELPTMGACPP